MEVTLKLNHLRIAPRKVRLLADLIRGKKAREAAKILDFSVKRGSQPLRKLLGSAVASAKNDFQLDESTLFISKITVDEGPKLKRWRARARGRAAEIQKKTSHVTLALEGEKIKEAKKIQEPEKEEKQEKRSILEPKVLRRKPKREIEPAKMRIKGLRRIFRRKTF